MNIKLISAFLLASVCLSPLGSASAYVVPGGVDVQVNEGDRAPTAAAVTAMTSAGDDVRDSLNWSGSEPSSHTYSVSAGSAAMYTQVAQSGRNNVVTLYGCNTLSNYACNQTSSFPQTPAQINGFANWACWVVGAAGIPNLRAVTIWNEMNGNYNGGIASLAARQLAMANLLKVVVPRIRECNPNVAIYAGAFVGDSYLAGWFCRIQALGFNWSSVDGLDIHPYLSGRPDQHTQNGTDWHNAFVGPNSLDTGCGGITTPIVMPIYFSEWGGPALQAALTHSYFPTAAAYFEWFKATIMNVNPSEFPVAGSAFFLLTGDTNFPTGGLYTSHYTQPTAIGIAYQSHMLDNTRP